MGGAWKVAYADFVTAMMAFFLLLWVLNMAPPETKAGLAAYFAGESNMETGATSPVTNNPFIQNTDKIDTRVQTISETEKAHYAIAQKIKQMLMADAVPQDSSGVSADDVGVQLRVHSGLMFKPSSATLTDAAKLVLDDAVAILAEYNLYLVVRGHASPDELPNKLPKDSSAPYPSVWELSGARASAVVRYLIEQGIKPTRLRGVAYGDTRPFAPDDSDINKSLNRRVELYFHRPEVMSYSVVY